MEQLTYVRPEVVEEITNGQFLPTVLLTDKVREAIVSGKVTPRKGQWLIDGRTGSRGQFIGKRGSTIRVRVAKPNMKFSDYQKKLAA